jgi:hypothetical protein
MTKAFPNIKGEEKGRVSNIIFESLNTVESTREKLFLECNIDILTSYPQIITE